MRTILILLTVVFSLTISAQEITQDVGDFSELKVFDLVFVRLIQADENKVVIRGDYASDIKIINDDGVLKVRMHTEKRFRGEDTYIEVYAKSISVIDANEGSQITASELIKQDKIELRVQEGAKISVALQVGFAKMKAVSGGMIDVNGLARIQEIKINSGGIFDGRNLKTKDSKISVTAAGEAQVYASEKVDIRVTAGGNVYVYGNPTQVMKKRFAGGRIYIID